MYWWNDEFILRRQLKVVPENGIIQQGYPIVFSFDRDEFLSLSKMREDFLDLNVVYWNENLATPQWELLGHYCEYDDIGTGKIFVTFNAVENIETDNDNYYIYSCNLTLYDAPERIDYIDNRYIIELTPAAGNGIMFTRPTEDWLNGVSLKPEARASFVFYGKYFKIKVRTGPDRGLFNLYIDNEFQGVYDTYSEDYSENIIYVSDNLEVAEHSVKIQALGKKSPYSKGTFIEIISFDYSTYVEAQDALEEIVNSNKTINFIIGN